MTSAISPSAEHATVELEELSSRDPRRALINVREKMVALPQLYTLDLETGREACRHELRASTSPSPPITTCAAHRGQAHERGRWARHPARRPGREVGAARSRSAPTTPPRCRRPATRRSAASIAPTAARTSTTAAAATPSRWSTTICDSCEGADRPDPRVDIGGVLYHPTEHRPQAYATNWTSNTWNALDPAIEPT